MIIAELEDYCKTLLESIEDAEILYYTCETKKKTHAFVLRGLENGIDIRRMKEDLTASYKIIPRQIYRPLYLVVSEPAVTLKYLN